CDYVRVELPTGLKILYDIGPEDVGKGAVKVYDTLGLEDEGEWQQVLSREHVFKGDCVVENGLVRVRFDLDGSEETYRTRLYYWDGSGWRFGEDIALPRNDGYHFFKLRSVRPEEVVVQTDRACWHALDIVVEYVVKQGLPYVILRKLGGKLTGIYTAREPRRFDFSSGGGLNDCLLTPGKPLPPGDDNFLITLDDGDGFIHFKGRSRRRNHYSRNMTLGGHAFAVEEGELLAIGFVSSGLSTFREAEDATLGPGACVDTGLGDDSYDSVLLSSQGDYVSWVLKGLDELPVGRYRLAVRVKQSADPSVTPNDLRASVRNITDGRDLTIPPGPVELSPGNSFSFCYLDFEVDEEDGGDQIEIRVEKATEQENSIWVDYFLIIPLANGRGWPLDLAHNAMREAILTFTLVER
ncbi:hypothetical protein DRO32_05150, partial [Candidatus Bathyarchaeota archaeon]